MGRFRQTEKARSVDKLCYKRVGGGLKIRNRVYVRREVRKEEIDSAYSNEYGESIMALRLTQHIGYGYALPFGTLLSSVAMSYMLGKLDGRFSYKEILI